MGAVCDPPRIPTTGLSGSLCGDRTPGCPMISLRCGDLDNAGEPLFRAESLSCPPREAVQDPHAHRNPRGVGRRQ